MARTTGKYKRRNYARKTNTRKPKVSKNLKKAITQVIKKTIETKTINVTDPDSGLIRKNTINKVYLSASGLQYLAQDIFKVQQGVADGTQLGSLNRIGDKVRGVGFKMNYYFHMANKFNISSSSYFVPFVKLRIIVFRQAFGQPLPTYGTLYNTDFCNVSTYTLQPVDFHEGYVKEVLYDRVHILRAQQNPTDSVTTPNSQLAMMNVFHFQKYIKFDYPIKYMDDQISNPNGTDKPVHIALSAEIDDSWSSGGFPPSDTPLFWTTGYTQAWFKDA
ncbi:hypothetical protein [Rheinheimera sp.]|uniref:hypothetical protein n=1 Tax=Rheinheimera sp. TaxID=1869214 RepID=UPI004048E20B